MIWRLNLYHSYKSPIRAGPLAQGLHSVRQDSLTSASSPRLEWAIASYRSIVSQAKKSDSVAAWCPHSWKDRTSIREEGREVDFKRGKGTKGKGKMVTEKRTNGRGRAFPEWGYWTPAPCQWRHCLSTTPACGQCINSQTWMNYNRKHCCHNRISNFVKETWEMCLQYSD